MTITSEQVKTLREKTGAGMMDCKKALEEVGGDFDKAIDILRKKGASVAAKRAEREAKEGIILSYVSNDKKTAILLEVNCETDFVANSDDFLNFSKTALELVVKNEPKNIEEALKLKVGTLTLGDELTAIIGKIGEKISLSRFVIEKAPNGILVDYIHHGAKLGVILKTEGIQGTNDSDLAIVLKDIAMQIAAMKPVCIYSEDVPKDIINKEMEIYKELAKKEGKPENMLDKIAQGRINKFYQENCLFEQVFVKDNSTTVKNLVENYNKKKNSSVKLVNYHRFHLSDENK